MVQKIIRTISICLFLIIGASASLFSQVYKQTEGNVRFFSEATIEDIEAQNDKALCRMRASDSSIVVMITNSAFHFEKPLMEEHFNENYMESEKYPHSIFKGKVISGMDFTKDGEYQVTVKGTLTIHGVEKEREFTGTITKKGDDLTLHTVFEVTVADHGIEVPSLYIENIAEVVEVTADFKLTLSKK